MPVAAHAKAVRGGFLPAAVALLAVVAALSGPAAYATDAVWKGSPAVGDWNTAANWEGGVVPNSASYDVYIDGAKTGTASEVHLNLTTTIGNLAIDAGDRLTMNNGMDLTVTGTQIVNAGTIYADSTSSSLLDLKIDALTCTLSGGGVITLAQATYCRILGGGDEVLVNVDNTIQGAGQVGYNQVSLENRAAGLIVANLSGGVLVIDPNATAAVNRGTFRATGGGTLLLAGGTFDNAGGTIEALDGSIVELSNATVQGGLLTTAGSGVIRATATGTAAAVLDGTASAVANTGAFEVKHACSATLKGDIVNSGVLTVKPTGAATTYLYVGGGDVTLSGGGTVTLDMETYAAVRGLASTDRLVNVDNTIQGAGQVGFNLMALENQAGGLVVADRSAETLEVDPSDSGAVNRGTFRATGGGTLLLAGGTFDNAGGTIEALDASTVELSNATIQGGLLTTAGSGVIQVKTGSSATLKGDIVNSGVLTVKPTGAVYTYLYVGGGDVTLSGGGTVTLDMETYAAVRGLASTDRLVNVDNTIQGAGQVGYNQVSLENQAGGLVVADRSGKTLRIDPSDSGAVNRGTFRATGGGTLLLADGTFDNAGGTIEALDGSNVELSTAVIQGGLLTTAGSGLIQATATGTAGAVLDGTASAVTNAGAFEVKNACAATLKGDIVNSGVLTVEPSSAATTYLYVGGGDVTLSGGGTVTLDMETYAAVRGLASTDRLVNVDNTIQGAGQVGFNLMALENQAGGLVVADRSGKALRIDPSVSGAVNRGTFRATGGGTLLLADGTFDNAGGTIEALDGSTVELSTAVIQGGLLTTAGSGVIQVKTGSSATLKGDITNSGVLTVKPTSAVYTYLYVGGGDVTLSGGGTVALDMETYAAVRGLASTDRLVNVDNTIQGAGQVGYNQVSLENQAGGLVVADRSGKTLRVDPSVSGAVNRGTFRATGGGTLLLADGTFDNAGGTIEALDASTVELSTAVIQGGLLTTAGSGVIQAIVSGTAAAVLDGTAGAVTNAGAFEVKSGCSATLKGAIINSGTVTVNPTTATMTELYVGGGDVTLNGGGSITLGHQTYALVRGSASTDRLINVDNTIQGTGQVGRDLMRLLNRGTIDANADAVLTIDPSAAADGVVNEGLLRASAAGGLTCTSGTFTNSGIIEAAGGNVTFTSTATIANYDAGTDTLTGGAWKAMAGSAILFSGAPPIAVNAADVTLSGAGSAFLPINGLATNAAGGAFHVLDGRTFTTADDLDNAGTLFVGVGSTLEVTGRYVQTAGDTTVDGLLRVTDGVADILGGVMTLNTDAGIAGPLSLNVTNAEVRFGCNQHLDTLTIGDGGKVVFAGAQVVVLQHLVMDGVGLGAMTLTPEPATLGLLGLGLAAALARRRRARA